MNRIEADSVMAQRPSVVDWNDVKAALKFFVSQSIDDLSAAWVLAGRLEDKELVERLDEALKYHGTTLWPVVKGFPRI